MKKKILSAVIFFLAVAMCCSCGNKETPNTNGGTTSSNLNQLQILKTDLKLTQEQVLSRIKAEHIKENNGYLDSDEIIVMLSLEDEPLIKSYNEEYYEKYNSVADYVTSSKGQAQAAKISAKQEALITELTEKKLIVGVEHQYSTLLNAIAVKVKYGNLSKIENISTVTNTTISDTYNRPQEASSGNASAIENIVDVYETGIFNSSSVDYTGNGTAVAVLDSGFDCSHTVFKTQPEKLLITEQIVTEKLYKTRASEHTKDLELSDVFYSRKIPFVYDYADKDADVFPYDSNHGTHVAGIIGGKDENITGVAVNTQLVLMKVFPDLNDGADTPDILLALEDAVLLEVDAINMSLGSSCGFAREEDGNLINDVYDAINESGISLLTAASNSYSSGFGGEQGNTSKVTNPDSGTVGSPSTYAPALSVASISGTKSEYIIGNNSQVFFFKQSNSISGDENDFTKELGITEGVTKTYEYVTIPGIGSRINFRSVGDMTGKIALIRRGTNTFEEKAQNAKNAGAAACIIYNNVEGDITMSMGKSDHIPTISISKADGTRLAAFDKGTMTISYDYKAGPFMSDFSSWGPLPSLNLKPEITAHGGNITSSVPGGGYDQISGTSMATPNLCGIVVLIRQHLKEKYPDYSYKQISVLANQLLMSTATIVLNEEGNPYSPRKQGAGLASLYNAVNTNAYITVDGIDRSKLELFDDPTRSGVYEMTFNVVNLSNKALTYDLSVIGMTEAVSTSDKDYVAEKSQILDGSKEVTLIDGGSLSGDTLTVNASSTAKVKVVYTLSNEDKTMMDQSFPYGIYVEGFVKLSSKEESEINLNVPFLAFYGDWTEAPMFDKTYYEVESEAHDASIDDEDKLKADYYATTPYGSYFYNYIIPLGTYLYDVDTSKYDAIPASSDKIALSNILGTIDGLSAVYAGLLRCAKEMKFTIVDKLTGEEIWEHIDYNAQKAHSYGASPMPYYDYLNLKTYKLGLVNNRQYEFKMEGILDYGDGGVNKNVRNEFSFDFVLDDEAPVLKDVSYEKVYDKNLKKDRYYIEMVIYDNHYVQSISPIIFTSSESYNFLSDNPIPVYGEKGEDCKVRFEITDYLEDIYADEMITSALAFSIDDYALNSNIYLCQLPGTKGDFKFTKNGQPDGEEMKILSIYEDEIVDLTKYLSTTDTTVDENKDYLKYLQWSSSNEEIAVISEGMVHGLSVGRATITVTEQMELKQAVIIINVKERTNRKPSNDNSKDTVYEDANIQSIRFSYFDTLFAYSRAAQTSEIGSTGDRVFISSLPSINFYPGEKIKLFHDLDPWYAESKYEDKLTYTSTNPQVAKVEQDGTVTGLEEGSTIIYLSVEGSNLMASVEVNIKNEFVIEDRMLVAYKGMGGDVVIPDDEGILYIASYAFCLYETDRTIELTEEDYDANKIPSMNTSIKSIVIPHGVEEIQKYAFYNCSGLEKVVIPDSVKFIREYAFYKDAKLQEINLENIEVIGHHAFYGCTSLANVDVTRAYAIGTRAFEGCTSLKTIDLSALRNSGREIFKDCSGLELVTLSEDTKLSYAMFVNSGLVSVDIYEKVQIPIFCFADCAKLQTVNIYNDIVSINYGAFSECLELTEINFLGTIDTIEEQAFYGCTKIEKITLPNNELTLHNYTFLECTNLTTVEFLENTKLIAINGSIFEDTNLTNFIIDENNDYYRSEENYLITKDGKEIIFAAVATLNEVLTIDEKYEKIGDAAFTGAKITELIITNPNLVIGNYAFANCESLAKVTFPTEAGIVIGNHVFNHNAALTQVDNLDKVVQVGDYAFANTGIISANVSENAVYGEGVFFQSKIESVTIGKNAQFGLGAFQSCKNLKTVNMPEEGGVHFGVTCFAYDEMLETIDLSKTDSIIEDQTFYGCKSLKKAHLENVKEVGEYAFSDCSTLSYVSLPVVEKIKEGAFSRNAEDGGAPQFSVINLPDTLTYLGDGAFLGCEGLVEITLPSSLTHVGDYLFAYCLNLTKVNLPANLTRIGLYNFAGCKMLTEINLENIKEIADYAFACTQKDATDIIEPMEVDLSSVETIGNASFAGPKLKGSYVMPNLTSVGDYAFQNALLEEIYAPKLSTIGVAAFQNNSSLTEFVFADTLEYIGELAFLGCSKIETYSVYDNEAKVNSKKINDYALLDNGILYTYLSNGSLQLTSIPGNLNIEELSVLEGTLRIDTYAGCENKNIKKLILPDSLRRIGNYAFYGFDKLDVVEFKSVVAPSLEDSYNSDSVLEETDPGYELLHKHFDLFGYELYYYTFKDLVGKNQPMKMILPANKDVKGYDSIVFEAYFSKVENASRSQYVAMENSMIEFINYANEIDKLKVVKLTSEDLINKAVTAYNSLTQDPTTYNIEESKWNELVSTVLTAKEKLFRLKLSYAKEEIQALQHEIDNLPKTFDISQLDLLKDITAKISKVKSEDKILLDLTNYNQLLSAYDEYLITLENEASTITTGINNTFMYIAAATAASMMLGIGFIFIGKKRSFM